MEWTVEPVPNVAALSTVTDADTARSIDVCEERHGGDPDETDIDGMDFHGYIVDLNSW